MPETSVLDLTWRNHETKGEHSVKKSGGPKSPTSLFVLCERRYRTDIKDNPFDTYQNPLLFGPDSESLPQQGTTLCIMFPTRSSGSNLESPGHATFHHMRNWKKRWKTIRRPSQSAALQIQPFTLLDAPTTARVTTQGRSSTRAHLLAAISAKSRHSPLLYSRTAPQCRPSLATARPSFRAPPSRLAAAPL